MALSSVRRNIATMLSRALSSPSCSSLTVPLFNLQNPVLLGQAPNPFTAALCTTTSGSNCGNPWPIDEPIEWDHLPPTQAVREGCDYKHWAILLRIPGRYPAEEDVVKLSVKTLATILGSEEEAKKKIYSIYIHGYHGYTGFGAEISEELSQRVKTMPHIDWVVPDIYLDDEKDYGGRPFVDGKVIW